MIPQRLAALRQKCTYGIDLYMVTSADFHQSEICRRPFQGPRLYHRFYRSAGTAVISWMVHG